MKKSLKSPILHPLEKGMKYTLILLFFTAIAVVVDFLLSKHFVYSSTCLLFKLLTFFLRFLGICYLLVPWFESEIDYKDLRVTLVRIILFIFVWEGWSEGPYYCVKRRGTQLESIRWNK